MEYREKEVFCCSGLFQFSRELEDDALQQGDLTGDVPVRIHFNGGLDAAAVAEMERGTAALLPGLQRVDLLPMDGILALGVPLALFRCAVG